MSAGHRAGRLTLRRLVLGGFRNYDALTLPFDGRNAVLTGANGAGKTNLLEAVSLLAPGRGLRRATLAELAREGGSAPEWSIAARFEGGAAGPLDIGTGLAPGGEGEGGRLVRIDRVPQRSTASLGEHVAVLWLTPDLDGLFRGPAGERRRFLDRLALALDGSHGARVSALERLHRQRNRLLEQFPPDRVWLDAVERELAETAVAVADRRRTTVDRLAAGIRAHRDAASPFPHALLHLDGAVEADLRQLGATAAEDAYRDTLAANRPRDAAAGRATAGPHLSDLRVVHGPKGMAAARASTGEQKALLTGIVLAQARLVSEARGQTPLLLLDEIAAHLDEIRRAGLFEELDRLGAQAFMTGTDAALFAALGNRAEFFEVAGGRVVPADQPAA